MSKVFNMISGSGGGTEVETDMLYALGYVVDGSDPVAVTNGTVTMGHLFPSTLATVGSNTNPSVAYVRIGPISFKGKNRVNAVVSASASSNGTRRVVLFASQNEAASSNDSDIIKGGEATSADPSNYVSIVNSSNDVSRIVLAMDVSNYQTGSYYVYCGIDTYYGDSYSWANPRSGEVYGINLD